MAWYSPEQQMTWSLVSGNQFSIGGKFGLFSEAWQRQRGMDGSGWVRCWWLDQNPRDLAKKLSSTIKTNTLCHQWLGDRFKRGAFDICRNIMEQFSASLPHAPISKKVVPVKVVPTTHWQGVWSWDDIFLTTGLQVHASEDTWNWCPSLYL